MSVNVVWLQTGAQIGGTEMMNFRTWQQLHGRQFAVQILFLDEPGPVSQLYQQAGHQPIHLHYHQRPLPHVWADLNRILQAQPVHILHIFGTRANLLGRLAARRTPHTRVVCGQRSIGNGRPWLPWMERLSQRWVHRYISNSHAGARWLQNQANIPSHKIRTIHSGLDPTPFMQATPGQLRPSLGIPAHQPIIASIGNLRKIKDQETLLKAAKQLQDQGHPFHLLLVGEGQQQKPLAALCQQLNLQQRTHFLGRRTDVSAILAAATLKVLSSRAEGLPAAILEAMAAALPVVATAVGGVPELVQHQQTGLLVPPANPTALAQAIAHLLAQPDLAQTYGQAGQKRVQQAFVLAHKVAELAQAYQTLLSTSQANE